MSSFVWMSWVDPPHLELYQHFSSYVCLLSLSSCHRCTAINTPVHFGSRLALCSWEFSSGDGVRPGWHFDLVPLEVPVRIDNEEMFFSPSQGAAVCEMPAVPRLPQKPGYNLLLVTFFIRFSKIWLIYSHEDSLCTEMMLNENIFHLTWDHVGYSKWLSNWFFCPTYEAFWTSTQ